MSSESWGDIFHKSLGRIFSILVLHGTPVVTMVELAEVALGVKVVVDVLVAISLQSLVKTSVPNLLVGVKTVLMAVSSVGANVALSTLVASGSIFEKT